MATDEKISINKGDILTIAAKGILVTGQVYSANYYGESDGWYIELTNANVPGRYSYWKQGFDGGKIIAINGKQI
jgi:hypothetical protein